MFLWRISNYPDLGGVGAERSSGRWHTASPGKRLVYLAEHPAVALIENLANLAGEPQFFPDRFQLLKFHALDSLPWLELSDVESAPIDLELPASTRTIGDAWLRDASSALLRVPSIPSPESWNYLLNPVHPDAGSVTLEWARHIAYDKRLFHL